MALGDSREEAKSFLSLEPRVKRSSSGVLKPYWVQDRALFQQFTKERG